jgi:hypothetical protein
MIAAIAIVAEQRIKEAMERGEFDGLPGQGRPIDLDEDANVPEELKMAYKLLKNGGYLDDGTEGAGARDALSLDAMLKASPDERATHRRMLKLQVMEARARDASGGGMNVDSGGEYYGKVVERVSISTKEGA